MLNCIQLLQWQVNWGKFFSPVALNKKLQKGFDSFSRFLQELSTLNKDMNFSERTLPFTFKKNYDWKRQGNWKN